MQSAVHLSQGVQVSSTRTTVYCSCSLLEMWMGPAQNSVLREALSSGEQYLLQVGSRRQHSTHSERKTGGCRLHYA
jgi:hypothetical protein